MSLPLLPDPPLPRHFARACLYAARVYRDAAEHATPDEVNAWLDAAQDAECAAAIYQAAFSTARRRCIEQLREAGLPAFATALETGQYAKHFGL